MTFHLLRLLGGMVWLARVRRTLAPLGPIPVQVFQILLPGSPRWAACPVRHACPGALADQLRIVASGDLRSRGLDGTGDVFAARGLASRTATREMLRRMETAGPGSDRRRVLLSSLGEWLIRRIGLECELLCDQQAVSAVGNAAEYARVVLAFAGRGHCIASGRFLASPAVTAPVGHLRTVKPRIEYLLKNATLACSPPIRLRWRIALAAVVILAAGCAGSVRLLAQALAAEPGGSGTPSPKTSANGPLKVDLPEGGSREFLA